MCCRYKVFLGAIKPTLVLLLHEKKQTPVLPQSANSCPLYIMCAVSERTFPGVAATNRAFMESDAGIRRMGRPVLDFESFKRVARTVLTIGSERAVLLLLKACRSPGSKSVAVDTVVQSLCICLERTMVQILAN